MTRRIFSASLALLALVGTRAATAQTTVNGTATLTVGNMLYLSVTNTSPSFNPVAADLNAGFLVASTTSLVTTKANITHSVTLKSDADNFTFTGTGSVTKPSTDLQVSVKPFGGSFGSYSGLSSSSSAVPIVTSRPAGDYSSSQPEVQYKVLLSFADIPGTYTLGITYTIASG